MGGSIDHAERPVCHFFKEKKKGETAIFRSIDYPLDAPLPDKLRGNLSTLLEAFEYLL